MKRILRTIKHKTSDAKREAHVQLVRLAGTLEPEQFEMYACGLLSYAEAKQYKNPDVTFTA